MTAPGTVYLVGAGPGDPGLITVRGLEILRTVDAVVFDSLAPHGLLENARDDAELIDAGKRRGDHRMTQDEINEELVALSREGKSVCRLKGGDPFMFGRGGEEALALQEAGLPWEVVPGVTSPIAAPAYAGIPITQRGLASSLTVVTGSEDPTRDDSLVNWKALAEIGGTLAFVMGWKSMPRIIESLIGNGMRPETPAALVQWGSTPRQKTVHGTLENIVEAGVSAGIGAPVVLVVGEVSALGETLAWFETRPLFGKRVLVTRARSQASRLATQLEAHGALTVQVPTIEIAPPADLAELDSAVKSLHEYDWIVFTSANGVRGFWERLAESGQDARALAGSKVAAVGPATSRELASVGISADLVPDAFAAEALLNRFRALPEPPTKVLFPRSEIGKETLVDGLRALGATVDPVVAYRNVIAESSADEAKKAYEDGIDITTFTSSSSVENLVELLGGDVSAINRSTVACMGPITSETARANGIEVSVIASEQTIAGLVNSVLDATKGGSET